MESSTYLFHNYGSGCFGCGGCNHCTNIVQSAKCRLGNIGILGLAILVSLVQTFHLRKSGPITVIVWGPQAPFCWGTPFLTSGTQPLAYMYGITREKKSIALVGCTIILRYGIWPNLRRQFCTRIRILPRLIRPLLMSQQSNPVKSNIITSSH